MNFLQPNDRILFQGDSITDTGRRDNPCELGAGYVSILSGMIETFHPELNLEILNRGISGNRTPELLQRWKADCLDLKPQVLSIKIGVNDVWRKFKADKTQDHIPLKDYAANLETLCDQALRSGIRKIVLISPTTITPENRSEANDLLGEYDAHVRTFSKKIDAVYVDARSRILKARERNPKVLWTGDGCHPTIPGHSLIALAWYEAVFGNASL